MQRRSGDGNSGDSDERKEVSPRTGEEIKLTVLQLALTE
jgi:hypothetical protein